MKKIGQQLTKAVAKKQYLLLGKTQEQLYQQFAIRRLPPPDIECSL